MQLKRERPDSFKRLSCFCLPLPACVPSVVSNSVQPCGLQPTRLLCPRDSPGKNTGGGCHALIQGIFLTQASNPGLPHCRKILYHLSHQGSPRILEWVAYSFSRGSSRPWDQTQVSRTASGLSIDWATREALSSTHPAANSLFKIFPPTNGSTRFKQAGFHSDPFMRFIKLFLSCLPVKYITWSAEAHQQYQTVKHGNLFSWERDEKAKR